MRRTEGIAIVSALIIMAALFALGAGSMFLSMTNLKIAQNTRTQTIAEHNAASGLDLTLIAISRHFRISEGDFPTATSLNESVPTAGTFEVVSVQLDGDEGVVTVRGFGPNNALHQTAARFEGVLTPTKTEIGQNSMFGEGFVTNADIFMAGNGEYNIDLWAGGDIEATGGQSRLGAGNTADAGGSTCQIGKGRFGLSCPTGVDPPDIPSFDFDAQLAELQAERTCNVTVTASGYFDVTAYDGGAVCIDPGVTDTVTLTGTARNLYVLGDRTTSVRLSADTEPLGDDGVGIKLASGTVDLTDDTTSISGMNSIFALNHIGLKKDILDTESGNTVSHTLIATEGDVRLNGGGNSNIVVATFWTNGAWCVNGTLNRFRGSVLAKNESVDGLDGEACAHRGIRVNGSISDAGMPDSADNEDIPGETTEITYASAGIKVLARRP